MNVDNELVTMLLAEKKEAKETAVEMENIIDSLQTNKNINYGHKRNKLFLF